MEAVYEVPHALPEPVLTELRERYGAEPGDLLIITPRERVQVTVMREIEGAHWTEITPLLRSLHQLHRRRLPHGQGHASAGPDRPLLRALP